MLVGMVKNASLYNPLRRPKKVLKRREVVLCQMKKNGFSELYEKECLQEWSNGFLKRCAKVKKLSIFQRIKRWIRLVRKIKF